MPADATKRAVSPNTRQLDILVAAAKKARLQPPKCRLDGAKLMRREFLDHQLMDYDAAPSCSKAAFKLPRLRQCAFDTSTMAFIGPITVDPANPRAKLDGGLDGYNWKIRFGDSGPFVLKVFWDQEPTQPPYHYALQRECQNAAVLQMMRAAMARDDATLGPILVHPHPWSRDEALENMYAFCDENRRKDALADNSSNSSKKAPSKKEITLMPRTRKCYGWIRISGESLFALPFKWWPPSFKLEKKLRQLYQDMDYTALVYEYVEEGENNKEELENSLEFFRGAGFSHTLISLARNWKQSTLIDMSDIIYPGGFGWTYWRLTADSILCAV